MMEISSGRGFQNRNFQKENYEEKLDPSEVCREDQNKKLGSFKGNWLQTGYMYLGRGMDTF